MSINNKGNTLVIVILVIVGIVAAVFFMTGSFLAGKGSTTFNNTQIEARNNKRTGDVDAIAKALEGYYGQDQANMYSAPKPEWFSTKSVPVDVNGSSYSGVPTTPVASFHICATLEGSKPQYCVDSQHK